MITTLVSTEWLYKNIDLPNLIVLDASLKDNQAQAQSNFDIVRIPKARFFDLKKAFSEQSNLLPNSIPSPLQFEREAKKLGISKNSVIVVYDNIGIYSSPRVWWLFKVMGFTNIAVLDGGLPQWIASKYPVKAILETEIYDPGDFEADYQKKLIKTKSQVKQNSATLNCLIVDARIENRFTGAIKETRFGLKSGHIPMAINIPYTSVLSNTHFLPLEELKKVLKPDHKPLIIYCGSGVTACIVLLAYALINKKNCAIYDGSWAEWGQEK
ncbi:sulfurtransferase [Flavobacterium glaciei]|uniref:Thiosulfate/3-mercaptopyruvate sulfurtransferase n=1 Tax=Flavobacterium glaciei TaxID=386300 RepID=A0A562Q1N0_9FLAO|nr:sulfurtransferase [Flavobacterium glaciei]RDI57652.1 thiosulfate/3-mercaptopyruvate sulfurtransferase [Flavobacterium glaciei]TWI50548.1 thiosulfate/3-mercaptopyruvate sulfurtransferase [Flavobacterium glaciei]